MNDLQVVSATASSEYEPGMAMRAFDGNSNNFWHVAQSDSIFPKWLQADLGSPQSVTRVETNYGPYLGNIATDFEIWIGNDPSFVTHALATHIANNTLAHVVIPLASSVTGRYLRYVVNAVSTNPDGHGWWSACMYEMDIFDDTNHAPFAQNLFVYIEKNTPKKITLAASSNNTNPLAYSIKSGPAHGQLSGLAPALTYTPATDYSGPDTFTFTANDGQLDSNTATVGISVIRPISPYLNQVNLTNLTAVATDLVQLYGPRHAAHFSPYLDNQCHPDPAITYPKSNVEMSSDYVKALYESWGYQVTLEEVPLLAGPWTGHNVVATKVGTLYPNIFIEIGGHLDSQPTTPGAGDNASGSTAVVELARVLKDYSSRYSLRFINFVGHEHGNFNEGSVLHLNQALARGETIKAALIMDGTGWSELARQHRNMLWFNDPASERIADLFNAVRSSYGIDISWRKGTGQYSDNQSYWNIGLTAVLSIGGSPYLAPGYHGTSPDGGCGDTLDKLDFQNIYKTAQQNIAVLLLLDDSEPLMNELRVISATASSEYQPGMAMRAFDGNSNNFWHVAQSDSVFPKWLQADLGSSQSVTRVETNYGPYLGNIATDFEIWIGNDPSFVNYTLAAHITNNTLAHVVIPLASSVTGRYLRYVVNAVSTNPDGHGWWSACMYEMNIFDDTIPPPRPSLQVVAAVASSADGTSDADGHWPMKAFDSQMSTYWQVAQGNFGYAEKWLQADLGISTSVSQVVLNFGSSANTVASKFQLWISNDPTFAPGNYTIAANITGNSHNEVSLLFSQAAIGRWVRYVVTETVGPNWSDTQLAEMLIYGNDLPLSAESKYLVDSAVASSSYELPRTAPINAFNGLYDDFWHVSASDTFPKWVQADLGSEKLVSRVTIFYYGGFGLMEDGNKGVNFQIWVGNDINFSPGTYTVADSVTGNDSWIVQRSFVSVAGRYLRYVITLPKGTNFYNATAYEVEIWGTGEASGVPILNPNSRQNPRFWHRSANSAV